MGFSARSQLLSRIYPVSPSPVSSTQLFLQRGTSWLNWTQFSSLSWLQLSIPWWDWKKKYKAFYENAIFLNMTYFPVWQHSDLSNICTPNPSGDDSPARFILALVAISRRSFSSQSRKDFPDTQGKNTKVWKGIQLTNVFSRQSSPSWIMRGGFSKSSSAFWLQPQYTHLLFWPSTTWLLKVKIKKKIQIFHKYKYTKIQIYKYTTISQSFFQIRLL